ncbi:MAG: NADH-quinone oxidoreductase subunit NuoD, partial [Candidatus Hermodarchaeota archaeon]|nr:NADH-quinone oxidoreductase subunit NuoD [Candidatus Hermodarchaeota archaeon]
IEGGRGELCFHAISTGENTPYRVKVRGPTFGTILVMFPKLLQGVKIADVPVVYWSLDQCPADHDR